MYLPTNIVQDNLSLEAPPATGDFNSAVLAGTTSFAHAPTDYILTHAMTELFPGAHLTPKQWRESEYYRKGLDFPNGIGENVARYRADEFDHENLRQDLLNQAQPTLLNKGAQFAGSVIGATLDPINVATAVLAPEYIGAKAATLLPRLGENVVAQGIGRVGIGAAEGVAITAPQTASDYLTQTELGETPSVASTLGTLALGAGLGGLVRGVWGFHQPITVDADRMAKQTAVNQLASGKSIDVEPILQNGAFTAQQMRQRLEDVSIPLNTRLDEFDTHLTNRIAEQGNIIAHLSDRERANRLITGLPETKATDIPIRELLESATEIERIPGFLRSASQNIFLKGLPQSEEFQQALTLIKKPAFDRTASENIFLKGMMKGDEESFLTARIQDQSDQLNVLDARIAKTSPKQAPKKLAALQAQRAQLVAKQEMAQSRLQEIQGKAAPKGELAKAQADLAQLQFMKERVGTLKNELQTSNDLLNTNFSPVSPEQLKAHSDTVHSWRGDSAINENEVKAYSDNLEGISNKPQDHLEPLRDDMEVLRKAKQLDEEDENLLKALDESDEKLQTLSGALRSVANCLKGAD